VSDRDRESADRERGWAEVGEEGPVVRDRRRFDPETGERRTESGAGSDDPGPIIDPAQISDPAQGFGAGFAGTPGEAAHPTDGLEAELAERVADLQRVQAEYTNYRRRVERDRAAVAEAALASVMVGLLPVLDDIERARSHGEVTGGFGLVADGLETTLTKLGLSKFGQAGEPFDPTVHEALTHGYSTEVTEPVCAEIYQAGYRVGERVLRPARVAVQEPEAGSTPSTDDQPNAEQ
jgi:molecular chaperone GrpE